MLGSPMARARHIRKQLRQDPNAEQRILDEDEAHHLSPRRRIEPLDALMIKHQVA